MSLFMIFYQKCSKISIFHQKSWFPKHFQHQNGFFFKFRACGAVFWLKLHEFNKKTFSKKQRKRGPRRFFRFLTKVCKKSQGGPLCFCAPAKFFLDTLLTAEGSVSQNGKMLQSIETCSEWFLRLLTDILMFLKVFHVILYYFLSTWKSLIRKSIII
jgi:hypothetical protein